mmetsp:Transcript_5863/g.10958  ORF Transcript_5863/g.10958 Transcript_5863/m.10958 type:complete len:204 (-) Transcript_5863:271-882(-)
MYYLEDEDLARQMVELGYRGSGDTLTREEFEGQKKMLRERSMQKAHVKRELASAVKDFSESPFLAELASREEDLQTGKLTTILFVRGLNSKGQEVSGYIDLGARMKSDDFEPIFEGKKRLHPRPSDLSYYNWEAQSSTSNSSPNFQVITDNETGLLFKNMRDRKVIDVDPTRTPGDNTTRLELGGVGGYLQVVIFDHTTRRKT